jgi:hypothetical protein
LSPLFPIAKDDTDFIKIIFFLVVMAIVGISKLIQKFQENARKNQTREPRPHPQQKPPPAWRPDEDEVRKFLEQMERENEPQPPPPVIQEKAPPVQRPVPTFQQHVARDTGESSVADEAAELLQTRRPATHVEGSRDVERAADAFTRNIALSAAFAGTSASAAQKVAAAVSVSNLRKELRNRESIRRAFVLSEILGPPRGF